MGVRVTERAACRVFSLLLRGETKALTTLLLHLFTLGVFETSLGGMMTWLKQVFGRRQMYADLSQEIALHLEEKIAALVAGGMSPAEAERQARREFGNVALIEERGREAWQWPTLESIGTDVRLALRQLRKQPVTAAIIVLTFGLGIGASTATFSVANAFHQQLQSDSI